MLRPLFFALDLEGGKFFFNTVREGDSVLFATEDEGDASNWVMAFYRATGQAHKPQPPTSTGKSSILASGNGKLIIQCINLCIFNHQPIHILDQPIHVLDQPNHLLDQSIHLLDQPIHVLDQPIHIVDQPIHLLYQPLHVYLIN